MATWILTGSLENFRINVERGFDVIGFKERRRNQAMEFEPGDEVVFYVTGVQAFGGIATVRSEMFRTARRSGRRARRSTRSRIRGGSRPSRP
jgi:protein involved in polysaccharide export with SLBB domain